MPQIKSPDDSWASIQSLGTWVVAIGLLVYEGVARHFTDQAGLALLGGLLGLPVIINFDKKRKKPPPEEGSDG